MVGEEEGQHLVRNNPVRYAERALSTDFENGFNRLGADLVRNNHARTFD
jgi:hypothetical protein